MSALSTEKVPKFQAVSRENLTTISDLDVHEVKYVFGYGSLMWRPGFDFVTQSHATLDGFHRDFCITSRHHRGSEVNPGLVLGLDQGGSCLGIAFEIHPDQQKDILGYLDERELVGYPYRPVLAEIHLNGRQQPAFTYVADPHHRDYAGALSLAERASRILRATGLSGSNLHYFQSFMEHLIELKLEEPHLVPLANEITRRTKG